MTPTLTLPRLSGSITDVHVSLEGRAPREVVLVRLQVTRSDYDTIRVRCSREAATELWARLERVLR